MSALLLHLALAAAAPTITLDEVLQRARERHPSVEAADEDVSAAEGSALAAEGAFDPTLRARAAGRGTAYLNGTADVAIEVPTTLWGLSLEGGYRIGAGDFPIYDGKLETNDWGEARIVARLPLWRGGSIDASRAALARSRHELTLAESGRAAMTLDVSRAAALAWVEWTAATARLQMAMRLEALSADRAEKLAERLREGDIADVERIENERAWASRRARTAQARRAFERAAIDLSLYWRDESGATHAPLDPSRAPSWPEALRAAPLGAPASILAVGVDALLERALAVRPELRRFDAQRARLDVDVALQENGVSPLVSLYGAVSQDFGPAAEPLSSSSTVWRSSASTRGAPDAEVGLVVELPTFLRAARGRLDVSRAARARLEHERRLFVDRVRAELQDALSGLQAADVRLQAARDELAHAHALEEAERARFDAGDGTLLFVNLREQAAAEAEGAVLDATAEALRMQLLLTASLGALNPGGSSTTSLLQ